VFSAKTLPLSQYIIWLFLLMFSSTTYALTQTHVKAGEVGQGFLMKRLDQCYLVTPAHVIGEEFFANLIGGTNLRALGEAEPIQTFGYDLSILSVSGALTKECDTNINQFNSLDIPLKNATKLSVSSVNADGSVSLIPVSLTDTSLIHLRINPEDGQSPLYKGLSGSLVFLDKLPVGMLLSIDADSGEGVVLRLDRAIETIKPFFHSGGFVKKAKAKPTVKSKDPSNIIKLTALKWSHQPIAGSTRTAYLIDGDNTTTWQIAPTSLPASVEISTGGKSQLINGLLLSNYSDDKSSFIKDFEILSSRKASGKRGWNSIYSGTWLNNKKEKQVVFSAVKAKRLMLVVHSHWGSSKAVGMSEFEAR
jgi:hypothetical protein